MGRSYKNAKKLEQVAEEFSWGKGSVYCPELVELLEEDKELQADLRYLLGAGRIRTCYSVYGKAVDQTEIEESRLFTDIENWEASSRKQSDEEEIRFSISFTKAETSRQLLGALARNSLIILYVDMMSGEYKVYYRGNQRLLDKRFGQLLRRLPERISGAKLRTG